VCEGKIQYSRYYASKANMLEVAAAREFVADLLE